MATAAVQPKISPEEYLASQPKVSPEEYLATAAPVEPAAAPPVHTESGFGPPQAFQGVKSASPLAAAQGVFADYNSRWTPKPVVTTPPPKVAGMEKLGGAAPAPPPVQMPAELDPAYATPSTFQNPRTGKIGTNVAPGRSNTVANVMDSFVTGPTEIKQGVEQMSEGTGKDIAGGASKVLRGGMQTATPLMIGAGAVAPLATVATVATGTGLQAGSEKVLKAAGVPDEYAALGGDLVGLFGAGAAYKRLQGLSRLPFVAEGNAIAAKLRVVVERAKDQTLTAMERAAARVQVDSLTQGLRRVEAGEPSTGTPLPPMAAAGAGPPIVDKSGERMPVFGEEHLAKAEAIEPTAEDRPAPGTAKPSVEPSVTPEEYLAKHRDEARRFDDLHAAATAEYLGEPQEQAEAPPATPPLEQTVAAVSKAQAGPTFGSGLGALQPHYDAAVATLMGDVEATRALIAKRDVALTALKKAESTPAEKDAGQKILQYFTGERDVWGARMNQVMERLRKVVPDHTEQEGLSLMRDFKSRPGELQEFLAGTHPTMRAITDPAKWLTAQERIEQMRPSIEKALSPTPGMMAADSVLTNIAELSLLEGRKRGFLESNISSDEYVTHLLHPPEMADFRPLTEKAGSLMGGKIGRRFAFSESRQYPTLLDAVADNQKPRTLNALTAFTIHADKFATSRATSLLVDQLKNTGVGKWGVGTSKVPDGWVEIAPHAHPFQNTINTLSQAGDPTSMTQKLYVPKFIEEALRPITDPDFSNKIVGFMPLRVYQAWTKSIQLGLSAFHATAMNYMAASNMGAKGWTKGWMADRDSTSFLEGERRFIAHGGTTSIQGKTFEAYKSLEPGSIPGKGDILRVMPGIATADRAANKITEFTFGKLQRQFKVTDFALKEAAWTAKNPTASGAQRAMALQGIAKEINAVYGGLHWENLGVNRTSLNVARALMLAPDWTLSNYFNVKTALEGGAKAAGHQALSAVGVKAPSSWAGSAGSDAARAFWVRQAVGGLTATQMMSLLLSGKLSQRPTDVYMGTDRDGNEIYQNMFFKGASGDLITLVKNSAKLGLLGGAAKTALGKAAPLIRTGLQTGMNEDYRGQAIIPKGTDFLPATVRGLGIAASDMAPIPLSGVNLFRMATGPKADSTTLPEYLTTPFVGQPPAHVPPEGMRMTPQGLKSKKEAPAKSFWDQTFNRKGPPPVRLGR